MNTKTNRRESGFTVIELIIVIVVVIILAALVVFSYNGVRSRDRDSARQENIVSLQGDLEIYYAQNSKYPTLDQINDSDWRGENMPELSQSAIEDPSWSADGGCSDNERPILITEPTADCYAYHPTAADGESCSGETSCAHYTLTATLETGEEYIKTSLN